MKILYEPGCPVGDPLAEWCREEYPDFTVLPLPEFSYLIPGYEMAPTPIMIRDDGDLIMVPDAAYRMTKEERQFTFEQFKETIQEYVIEYIQ